MILTHTSVNNEEFTVIDVISLVLDLMLFGFVAVVGTIYFFDLTGEVRHTCKITQIPLYLMISGYTNIVLSAFRFFVVLTGSVIQGCFNFAMVIYGSILIFAEYPGWERVVVDNDAYCYTLPFITAFVMVVVQLLWFGTVLIVMIFILGGLCLYRANNRGASSSGKMDLVIVPKGEWDTQMSKLRRYSAAGKKGQGQSDPEAGLEKKHHGKSHKGKAHKGKAHKGKSHKDEENKSGLALSRPVAEDSDANAAAVAEAATKELKDKKPELG